MTETKKEVLGPEKRHLMLYAMVVFLMTGTLAVAVNSIAGYGFHTDYSISKYVGLETWSAVMFALGNIVVAGLMLRYMYDLGETWKLPRWFFWVVVVMAAALICLSAWPVGYFDVMGAGKSVPTRVHETSSRLMFAMMLVVATVIMKTKQAKKWCRWAGMVFLVYGVICVVGYLTHASWFMNVMLFFEAFYLLSFMVLCFGLGEKKSRKIKE